MATSSQDAKKPVDAGAPTVPTPTGEASPPAAEQAVTEDDSFVPQEDAVLAGKYKLERMLGRGGMGSVWVAEHMTLRSPIAIKLIDPKIAKDKLATERFLREAQSAATLRGRNVVQILDYGVDQGTPYIAMELLEGESLAARLAREQRLSPEMTAEIISDVCRAVGRAHESGIIHRDLKPDNIFIVKDGDTELAKVLDFGIAKAPSEGSGAASTQTGALLGTPYYMSPEQAKNSKNADHRSDLWAIGVITYECIVGKRPFESEQITDLVLKICTEPIPEPSSTTTVPGGFDAWFAKAVDRDPELRFQSERELVGELRQVVGLVTSAVSMVAPTQEAKSNSTLWIVGGFVVAGGLGLWAFSGTGEDPPRPQPQPVVAAKKQPAKPLPTEKPKADPPAKPPLSKEVAVRLDGAPEGAEVYMGDERIGLASEPLQLPRSSESTTLRIVAKGFRDGSITVAPTSDLSVPVTLEKAPKKTRRKPRKPTGDDKPKKKKPEVSF